MSGSFSVLRKSRIVSTLLGETPFYGNQNHSVIKPKTLVPVMCQTLWQTLGPFSEMLQLLDPLRHDKAKSLTLLGFSTGTLSSIPTALTRWTEECKVLDAESMHDCVSGV